MEVSAEEGPGARLARLLDVAAPAGPLAPEARRRARVLAGATAGLVVLIPPSTWMYLHAGMPSLATSLVAAGVVGLANLHWMRRTGRIDAAAHVGMGVLFSWLFVENLAVGGLQDPNFAWFHVVPLAALQVLPLRGAAVWFGLTLGASLLFYGLAENGWSAPLAHAIDERGVQALFNRVTLLAAFGLMAWSFVHGQRRAEAELTREAAFVNLVSHTAVSASEADSFEQAVHDAAARIAREMGWIASQVYRVDREGRAHHTSTPYLDPARRETLEPLATLSTQIVHEPGEGLPGRAIASERVVTLQASDARADAPRTRVARRLGILTAYAVPILARGEVVAVIEFASPRAEGRDGRLESVLAHIGAQLGRLAERTASTEQQQMSRRISAVGHVAAGLAHELNNPLAFARTNLAQLGQALDELEQKLPRDAVAASQTELCDTLVRETAEGIERAIAVVRDVRKLSQLERGDFERVDVSRWLREAVRFATSTAPPDIRVGLQVEEGLTLEGAPNLLHQVVVNLVENAVQSIGSEGRIRLEARQHGDGVRLRVEDDGPGIADAIDGRLFEPFATTRAEGTGLGLYLVYGIVRSHGGRISAESRPGEGATFELWLPSRQSAPSGV